jgi:hypothetical protein
MTSLTPVYGIPYQTLADAPDGPNLGEDGFLEVEQELVRIDAAIVANDGATFKLLDAVQTDVAVNTTTVGAAELSLPRLVSASVALDSGKLYRTDFQLVTTRTVIADEYEIRVRKDTALTGTLLGSAFAWGTVNANAQYAKGSILWVPSATGAATLHMSVIRSSGSGTMTVYHDNFSQAYTTVLHYKAGSAALLRTVTT